MQEDQIVIHLGNYSYTEKYCLGQGSFGKVYKGLNKTTNKTVAIKEVDALLTNEKEINKQISILKQFKHRNIVEYEDAFQNGGFFYIVTEYCNGGDLRNMVQDSDQSSQEEGSSSALVQKLLDMFFQICQGFNYLRKFQIIHRDLKPSNILINNGVYKIADFGLAKTQQLNRSVIQSDLKGVPIYMSPQILSRNYYTFKCDVWSIGVILYELFFDQLPWKANDTDGLFFEIMRHPSPYIQSKKRLPTPLKNILDATLRYLQKDRLSWGQLLTLQKGRRKIFKTDLNGSHSLNKSQSVKQDRDNNNLLRVIELPQNVQKRQQISPSKISPSLSKSEAEVLNHIRAQCQCLVEQLEKIITQDCLYTFIQTLEKYIKDGTSYRECLNDCAFMLIRRASENLHVYMIDLESLQDARQLLVLMELISGILKVAQGSENHTIVDCMDSSKRGQSIEVYAAEVISQMNTILLNRKIQE